MGIRYELLEYEVDPEDLAAEAVAAKIGLPPGQLFKTLVPRVIGTASVCSHSRDTELDVKRLLRHRDRKIHLAP